MAYAVTTKVSVDQTATEIERMVMQRKAANYAKFSSIDSAAIAFEMQDRRVLFRLPLPKTLSDQQRRSKWRGLMLCIKAKFESIESGIETFEDAFLSHIVTPNGLTVGEQTRPAIAALYKGEPMQALLPAPRKA